MPDFAVSDHGDLCLVAFPRHASLANARELLDAVKRELGLGRASFVFDLRGTEVIDSTGLGAIVQLARAASSAGGGVTLLAPRENVRRVLAITRLDQALAIRGSLPELEAVE